MQNGNTAQGMTQVTLGRYRLLQRIGRGGMGEVWLGEDPQLRRQVAVKTLPSHNQGDREYLQRFEREARAAAALNHPHILPVHDYGEQVLADVLQNKSLLSLELNEPVFTKSHTTPYVWGLSWSPNGKYMTICYPQDPRIYIWDVQLAGASAAQGNTRQEIEAFPAPHHLVHTAAVTDVAWSPDGRYIASSSADQTIVIWKVDAA